MTLPPEPPPPPPPGSRAEPGTATGGAGEQPLVYEYGSPTMVQVPRAPYFSRVVALVIDSVVLFALPFAGSMVFRFGPRRVQSCELTEDGNVAILGQEGVRAGLCEVPTAGAIAAGAALFVAGIVVWFLYIAREGRSGQTWGKQLVRIRTVDADSGQPIGTGRALGRSMVRGVLALPLLVFIGFLVDHVWPLWDRRGQTLHDKATNAVVTTAGSAGDRR